MAHATATRLAQLERQREVVLNRVRSLGDDTLRTRPQPEAWSILEILEHLVVSEAVILQGLPPWVDLEERPRTLAHRVKLLLVRMVLGLGIPVKVPSRRMLPSGTLGLDQVSAQWRSQHGWLHAFLAEAGPSAAHQALFRHPVAGPITLHQALGLDLRHLRTHRRQIEARLRELPLAGNDPSGTHP